MQFSVQRRSNRRLFTDVIDSEATPPLLRPRMPELDTIRGIAVLLVLFFHGFGFRYGLQGLSGFPKLIVAATLPGWTGVNLFFVLSGFLITGILLDSKSRAEYYRTFYIRRGSWIRSEEHTSELQSHLNLVCRLLLEKKK